MNLLSAVRLQPPSAYSDASATLCWQLLPGSVLSFEAGKPVLLRITQGRIWLTLDGPHSGAANDWGDVVLQSGDQFALEPGQRIVVEAWTTPAAAQGARLVWSLAPHPQREGSWVGGRLARAFGGFWRGRAAGAGFGRFLGVLGLQSGLQCHAGPGCHGMG